MTLESFYKLKIIAWKKCVVHIVNQWINDSNNGLMTLSMD
jgi:hypothetical protein